MAGLRVLELEELFNIDSPTQTVFSKSDNELFGVQFGIQGLLLERNRWRLETSFKAGALYNHLNVTALASSGGMNVDINEYFNHMTFVGDLQLTLLYQVSPRLLVRAGYQGLWLEGVALAPDQTDNGDILLDRLIVDLGTAIYQGGFLGGELTY